MNVCQHCQVRIKSLIRPTLKVFLEVTFSPCFNSTIVERTRRFKSYTYEFKLRPYYLLIVYSRAKHSSSLSINIK